MNRAQIIAARIAALEAEAARLAQYPETDPFADGDAIMAECTNEADNTYVYLYYRVNDRWCTTGSVPRPPRIWSELVAAWMSWRQVRVFKMKRGKELFTNASDRP